MQRESLCDSAHNRTSGHAWIVPIRMLRPGSYFPSGNFNSAFNPANFIEPKRDTRVAIAFLMLYNIISATLLSKLKERTC